jgi:hypothetical protein
LAGLTRSSDLTRLGNPRATASVLVGLLAVAMIPLGVVAARYSGQVTLLNSTAGSIPAALILGLSGILLGRRGRERATWTLGRSGGLLAARVGTWLGVLAICMAATASLAIGFYGLLTLFAS